MDGEQRNGAAADEVDPARVRELAFVQAVRLLLPAQIAGTPLIVGIGLVARHQLDALALTAWWVAAAIALSMSVLAWVLHRHDIAEGGSGAGPARLIHASTLTVGLAWGFALFVPEAHDIERMLTFAV